LSGSREHGGGTVSAWIRRWSDLVAERGTVLDVACGYGRHMRWFAGRGHAVVGVDSAADAIEALADLASAGQAEVVQADIENSPWPFMDGARPRQFDAVVVTNYLWRPLMSTILRSLAPGGVLLYETFATGNASVGKPSRPDFLLATGELLQVCTGLRVVAYEDGYCEHPSRFVQRIVAVRSDGSSGAGNTVTPPRFPL
jgi:SAM-dependent methyltransferase